MIVRDVGPDAVFHRFLTPKWAFVPLSGAGAAVDGGRFNRPGIEALYLAAEEMTALAECKQDSSIAPPLTLASYFVTFDRVVDLSAGFDPNRWSAEWAGWNCSWRKTARLDRAVPPSWILADHVIASGYKGLLFPSTKKAGGTNFVIYPQNLDAADELRVHDPHGHLPRDPSSWQ